MSGCKFIILPYLHVANEHIKYMLVQMVDVV